MLDTDEAAFLRSIAEEQDGKTSRLIFADWLEERGQAPRADFVRVQCELASAELTDERRLALRARERELLDAHRREWCGAFGLPLEEVAFEGGVIAKARLARWDASTPLDPAWQRLATLAELDLSELQLGSDDLAAFAGSANLPALRKLILSDNRIDDAGVSALATAKGLPRLDTVYLFGNPAGDRARVTLERSSCFRLTNLDLGEADEGYRMSPGEAEMGRRRFVRMHLVPVVTRYFNDYELLRSAALCVAQYWDDEANDAVHDCVIVSELPHPILEGVNGIDDESSDPNVPNVRIGSHNGETSSIARSYGLPWDDNGEAIPLWAAFTPEDANQEFEYLNEAYGLAAAFYRHGGYEFMPMIRPHLDGVEPEQE